jgi:hypothetical protein
LQVFCGKSNDDCDKFKAWHQSLIIERTRNWALIKAVVINSDNAWLESARYILLLTSKMYHLDTLGALNNQRPLAT